MITFRKNWCRVLLCVVSVVLAGCLSGSSGTIPVTGKINKAGQPVSGAAVTFVPVATDGKAASGTTDASGVYQLTTYVNGDGALPGSYKVIVTKFPGAAASGPSVAGEANPADVDAAYKAAEKQGQNVLGTGGQDASVAQNELNAKYASADTSGLTAEVKAGATKTFDFSVD